MKEIRVTSYTLKLIAIVTMLTDHTGAMLGDVYGWGGWYWIMRRIGRIAFPIFAFLLVEGFIHTHNRRRYGLGLLLFALVSEVPWMLLRGVHLMGHNVMFTLLAGFLALCAIEQYRTEQGRLAKILLGLIALMMAVRTDYGGTGVAFVVMLYCLRRHLLLQAIVGSFMLPMKWIAGLAFVPIAMYNGERGFIQGPWAKYLFYAFYPLHLLLIWWIRTL